MLDMNGGQVEDIYPLSPMQRGMLFHTLYDPQSSMYFQQAGFTLYGDLDVAAFRQAWAHVQARHAVLRSAVVWEDLDEPLQIVLRQATLPLSQHDWRDASAANQSQQLAAFMAADRARGFDLAAAPLMRLALIRLADECYQLIWSRQHLLLDGWSVGLVFQEVFASYAALVRGQPLVQPKPRPYRDYITWLQQQDLTAAATFWREALAGVSAPTALGVDRPDPGGAADQDYMQQSQRLGAATTAGLQALARAQHLTLNTLLQGGWALLLHRYSGADDVIFGTTVAGRPAALAGVEAMVGLFINTLPVRVRLAASARLMPWLRALLAEQATARRYEYAPLVQIQGWSDIPRGQPLFESLFVFENYPINTDLQILGGRMRLEYSHSFEQLNYLLTVVVVPEAADLRIRIEYDRRRFDDATIARLFGHLRTVLQSIVEQPDLRLADVPILTAAERQQLLNEWQPTALADPAAVCIHQLFEAQAARTPDAVAIVLDETKDEGRRTNGVTRSPFVFRPSSLVVYLTYAELNRRANELAQRLSALGAGPERFVGLGVARSPELLIGVLGILKVGAACLPSDDFPDKEIRRHGDKEMKLFPVSVSPGLPVSLSPDLRVSRGAATVAHPAYAAYSSALIVSVTHRAAQARLHQLQQAFALSGADVLLHQASLTQDTSICELLWPLLHGARLVVADGAGSPADLRRIIADQRVSVLPCAPALLAALLSDGDTRDLGSLRYVLCSGAPLRRALAETFVQRLTCELYYLYGLPEAACITIQRYTADAAEMLLGQPIGVAAYVLDSRLQPVPIGLTGELYVAGPSLARGYLGRPELTAERFVPDPFAKVSGIGYRVLGAGPSDTRYPTPDTRLYKTGELVRWRDDGTLVFMRSTGRHAWIDGFRVALSDLEAALLTDPTIAECAILARETAMSTHELVAYVVAIGTFSVERLRAHLLAILPAALLPSAYVALTSLPLTAAGLVDQQALASLAVIDAALVQQWEDRLRAQPLIAQAAVVVQEQAERPPLLHLSELLPSWRADESVIVAAPSAAPPASPSASTRMAFSDGGPLVIPADAPKTLGEALIRTATRHKDTEIVHICADGSAVVQTYAELLAEAQCILAGLSAIGLRPHDKAILQIAAPVEYLPTFWACILGGITPVTVAVAPSYTEKNGVVGKLYNTWELLGRPPILASDHLAEALAGLSTFLPMRDLAVVAVGRLRAHQPSSQFYPSAPDHVAFFQLTSGSTGIPKCIQETHRGIISHIHASQQAIGYSQSDITLNWLPFDHVVPLLMYHIKDVYLGCRQIQVRTDMILADPLKWLDYIESYRVTHTWSPNFGYKLVSDRIAGAPGRSWQLDSIRSFVNAGEQVTLPVVREFLRLVAPFQVAPRAMQPAYGMAELCTAMTYVSDFELATGVQYCEKTTLAGPIALREHADAATVAFVVVGPPVPGVQIQIVDAQNRRLPERVIGRVQVRGAVVTPGYLNNPAANQEAFADDGWFYTGDLGFLLDGRLTITGREKEVIIINGVNYYCYEIEDIVNAIAGVEATYVGVCAIADRATGSEGLAIFFSPTVERVAEQVQLITAIRASVVASLGLNPAVIVPVPKNDFPKTTSGKIQRSQLKQSLAEGQFQGILKAIDLHLENSNTLPDWFYRTVWRRKALLATPAPHAGLSLVLRDRLGLGAALAVALGRRGRCVLVDAGAGFAQLGLDQYQIDPTEPADYRRLLEAIAAERGPISQILHLWHYDEYADVLADADAITRAQDRGVYSLLFLCQALVQAQGHEHAVGLYVISSYAQPATPGDQLACERTPISGLVKTLPQELPWLHCRQIDLPIDLVAANAARVLREIGSAHADRVLAYRDGQRLVARLEKVDLRQEPQCAPPFVQGGMYVITGGLGGIGRALAQHLHEQYDARLLLIGRTALPDDDDAVAPHAIAWRELRQLGDAISYEVADVCDLERLQALVERARARWQCDLAGVIHLAGSYHERVLAEETRAGFAEILRPKLLGTIVLNQLLAAYPDSLFISFSSANGFFGGFSVGAYAAANSFLDGFVHAQRAAGRSRSYCFAWSMWDETGISHGYQLKDLSRARGYHAITVRQGLHSLLAGLYRDQPQLLIGLDGSKAQVRRNVADDAQPAQRICAYFTASEPIPADVLRELVVCDRFQTPSDCDFRQLDALPLTPDGKLDYQALPELAGSRAQSEHAYIAPQTDAERTIAAIWQAALHVDHVGINDNFFDLGGHSLLVAQIQSKLRDAFQRDITMVDIFKYPTVSALASYVAQEQSAPRSLQRTYDRTQKQKQAINRHKQSVKGRRQSNE